MNDQFLRRVADKLGGVDALKAAGWGLVGASAKGFATQMATLTVILVPITKEAREDDLADLLDQVAEVDVHLRSPLAKAVVEQQAADEGLWFGAATAPEAYLQQELRRLHAAVEGDWAAAEAPD